MKKRLSIALEHPSRASTSFPLLKTVSKPQRKNKTQLEAFKMLSQPTASRKPASYDTL